VSDARGAINRGERLRGNGHEGGYAELGLNIPRAIEGKEGF
jgi:hypothetical protein